MNGNPPLTLDPQTWDYHKTLASTVLLHLSGYILAKPFKESTVALSDDSLLLQLAAGIVLI